ncbi:MAG: alpha/beta hydrolase [Candidatus Schekmanbacteria bacterium]|nr:alpha/beta hydrolase [Candidatus Schekmanbacteria bacterium]
MRRFKTNVLTSFDGTQIHYESSGDGFPLVCCNGIGVSTFFWSYFRRHFSADHRIVLWDYRGHGKSGVPSDHARTSIQDICRDLKLVLDDEGVDHAVFLGHSMGVQVIFEFYRMYPDLVAGLVPVCGSYGRPFDTFLGSSFMHWLFPFVYHFGNNVPQLAGSIWKTILYPPLAFQVARLGFVNHCMAPRDDFDKYFEHLGSLDFRTFVNMARYMKDHTCEDILPDVAAPTLIVAGEHDNFTPHHLSEQMARLLPDGELFTIRGGSHAALVEQPDLMNLKIEQFLSKKVKTNGVREAQAV